MNIENTTLLAIGNKGCVADTNLFIVVSEIYEDTGDIHAK